jgi:dolichol kinase
MLNVVDAASQIKPFMLNVVMLYAVVPIKPQRGFNVRIGEFTNFLPFRKCFLRHLETQRNAILSAVWLLIIMLPLVSLC